MDIKNRFIQSSLYATPPLGLGYLASVLRQNGYEVSIIDMGPENLTFDDIIQTIKDENCPVVGISSFIASHVNGMKLAKEIKESLPEITVVVGGPQASFIARDVIMQGYVDIVCRFESEITFLELMDAIHQHKDLQNILGITYADHGNIIENSQRPLIDDLDSIPFPAWDLYKLDNYNKPGIVITGRGCPYQCIFCAANALSGTKYRRRTVNNIISEIKLLYFRYGIKEILFADDTFTADKQHCIDLCKNITSENLKISWIAQARANTVDEEIAMEMAKAGCTYVQIGAESGDDGVLKAIKKNITTEDIERAIKIFNKYGISVVCSFIIGYPYDTKETIEKTIEFAIKIHKMNSSLVKCKFSILTPLPGTFLYENRDSLNINILTDNWEEYTFSNSIMETKNLSSKDIQEFYSNAILRYLCCL
ncbi:radical SAM protein [Ruminiclostridium herbifermentans]|uniref:Radical SAM protein n=1 Tax=Ruminiclostridium herbifermentans TaxID=2488810 RepID=A0A4U7J815_9FIRM|nr:radical SAM protein [Ruminiclostridium herbifermentans]QNU66415.1 radical SAM protein [Ruminiclostridium herbifermentans]